MAEILLGNIKGENGATYTPAIDSDGNLSWSNDKGLPNPPTVNIKGPQGPAGSGGSGEGGSGDGFPRTGNRGVLAGYEEFVSSLENFGMVEITENAPDISMAAIVNAPDSTFLPEETDTALKMKSMTKVVLLLNEGGVQVNLGTNWYWKDNEVPTFSAIGLLIFHVPPFIEPVGFVTYVPLLNE